MVRHPRVSPIGVVFGCTIFASSALLFLVQPMFARMALPMLGGSPSVWNTCVVFFQAALLCGYGYAHLVSRLALSVQVAIHAVLSAIAIGTLPIAIPAEWQPPADGAPVIWLLGLLAAQVAVPFVVASAAGPLLQRWFSLGRPAESSDPYLLYATSNLGSLASLLAYPFIVEPRWPLPFRAGSGRGVSPRWARASPSAASSRGGRDGPAGHRPFRRGSKLRRIAGASRGGSGCIGLCWRRCRPASCSR
jgi:hypothetical protein